VLVLVHARIEHAAAGLEAVEDSKGVSAASNRLTPEADPEEQPRVLSRRGVVLKIPRL
jgi:hypothetical protein